VLPLSPSRSQPQVIDRQEPKSPTSSLSSIVGTSTLSAASSHRLVPLHLPELHLGFMMLLDVRSDTIRLRSQPLMSSSSNEPPRAPQRRSAAFDPEPVYHHLPELTTNSMPHYEPRNVVSDLSSSFLPPSPIPLSFSTTDSLASEPPTSPTPPIRVPHSCVASALVLPLPHHWTLLESAGPPPARHGGKDPLFLPWTGLESHVGLGPVQQWHLAISIRFNLN
jgi:hypothetical protein